MTRFRIHALDPSDAVEQAFFRVQHERMADVPLLNAALRVEAVGFRRWQGCWLGIVITPWCMSVLLVPADPQQWVPAAGNSRRFVQFPYGQLAFLASHEPELGDFQSCALFSPMERFATQAQALATARAAMLALLAPPGPSTRPVLSLSKGSGRTDPEAVRAESFPVRAEPVEAGPSTGSGRTDNASRRRFLGLGAENTRA